MLKSEFSYTQNLIDLRPTDIPVFKLSIKELTEEKLKYALGGTTDAILAQYVGISVAYSPSHHRIKYLTLAIGDRALVIQFEGPGPTGRLGGRAQSARGGRGGGNQAFTGPSEAAVQGRQVLETILGDPGSFICSFDIAPMTLALFLEQNVHISNGIDLQDAMPGRLDTRDHVEVIQQAVGDEEISKRRIKAIFQNSIAAEDTVGLQNIVSKAWVAAYISRLPTSENLIYSASKVSTFGHDQTLMVLAQKVKEAHQADASKPGPTKHLTKSSYDQQRGQVNVRSQEWGSRMRGDGMSKRIQVQTSSGGSFYVDATVLSTEGARSVLDTQGISLEGLTIKDVIAVEEDGPTRAQVAMSTYILHCLQGKEKFLTNEWAHAIYGKPEDVKWPSPPKNQQPPPPIPILQDPACPLNPSQSTAVTAMLSSIYTNQVLVVQGPPGTGKTSVIAAFVNSAISGDRQGIWLVAQSNIAVKNIAEKLLKDDFTAFRILVSKEFHQDWHEHLYHEVRPYMLRSERFSSVKEKIDGVHVFLCTLSMLSHPLLKKFTKYTPIHILVVDEASQIATKDYLTVINSFHRTLKRMVFIGDPQQLPPFGGDSGDIQSIFEIEHLKSEQLLLNTQYRMPPQIGDFISKAVYDSRLLSWDKHKITSRTTAVHFIDVVGGIGVRPPTGGTSSINTKEKDNILVLASKMQEAGLNYRIITPYDAQRELIETGMKENNLSWADKVHNVDSFQGNEDDYILISVVRHRELGFLTDLRRTNVMLTRCKRGMYIFTSKVYMGRDGKESLVGQLADSYGERAWMTIEEVRDMDMEDV